MNKKLTFAAGSIILFFAVVAFAQNPDSIRARIEATFDNQMQRVQEIKQEAVDQVTASLERSMDKRFLSSMERDFGVSLEELARDMAYIRAKHPNWKPQSLVLYSDCYTFISRDTTEEVIPVWKGSGVAVIFPASSQRRDALVPGIIYRANGKKAIINVTPTSKCYWKVTDTKEFPSRVFWTAGLSL